MSSVHDSLDEATEILPVAIAPNLNRLKARLLELGYSGHDREAIAGYAGELGTLEGCAEVEAEDRAELDAILETSWPSVPSTSRLWDDLWATPRQVSVYDGSDVVGLVEDWGDPLHAVWTLSRPERLSAIAEVAGVELVAVQGERLVIEELFNRAWDEPYEPTEEDLAAYRQWLAEQEDDEPGCDLEAYELPELEPFHS